MFDLEAERAASLRGAIADVRLAYATYLSTGDPWKWLHARATAYIAHHMTLEEEERHADVHARAQRHPVADGSGLQETG